MVTRGVLGRISVCCSEGQASRSVRMADMELLWDGNILGCVEALKPARKGKCSKAGHLMSRGGVDRGLGCVGV